MNRGLGPGLVLSVLVHGGAVAVLGALGAAWLFSPPPASEPAALYVDLVHPVIATSDRADSGSGERSASRQTTPRARSGGITPPGSRDGAASTKTPIAPAPSFAQAPAVEAPAATSGASEVSPPPAAKPAPPHPASPPESMPAPAPAVERPPPLPRMAAAPPPPPTDAGQESPVAGTVTTAARALAPPAVASSSLDVAGHATPAGPIAGTRDSAGTGTGAAVDTGGARGSSTGSGPPAAGDTSGSGGGSGIARLSPGDGQAGSASSGAIPPEYEAYVRTLRQRVQDRLVYPGTAVRRGQQGVVELEVRLGADGRLVAVDVVAGVSADALRGAAIAAVRSAAPFPFPPGFVARPLVVRLPVEFRLR